MTQNSFYMQRAITLAQRGMGFVNPNPMVGAVLVKDGRIIGEGYHEKYGDLHAERQALAHATCDPAGATLYVTLEPCCHHGKQPPCTDAILEAGISRVYIGSRDPNPLVSGKGVAILRAAGVEVHEDFMRAECDALNPIFFRYITTGIPYCLVKYAMTADGKIACADGSSRYVTGQAARARVQLTRKRCAAICVGIGTVLADDPQLTCRAENPAQPKRLVLDTHLRLPVTSVLAQTAHDIPTEVFAHDIDPARKAQLENLGVQVTYLPLEGEHVSLPAFLQCVGDEGIDSILFEGGAGVLGSLFHENLWDRAEVYVAPKLFGGDGLSPVSSLGVTSPEGAVVLGTPQVERIEDDVLLTYDNPTERSQVHVHGDH